jgi:lactate 2-monooxygenase
VDGIIVSNHGGTRVDGSKQASMHRRKSLIIKIEIPVLIDSEIRRGVDIIKTLALGANAVLVGRPFVYGLGLAGEDGVKQVLRNLIADFYLTLALSGKHSIRELNRDFLKRL